MESVLQMNKEESVRLKNIIHKCCGNCLYSTQNFFSAGLWRYAIINNRYCIILDELVTVRDCCGLWRCENGRETVQR